MTKTNKLTLKDNTISCCLILLICGGPCHRSVYLFSYGENTYFSWYHQVIDIVNIKILSLNFFSKYGPFNLFL